MELENKERRFYLVTTRIGGIPLSEHLEHGYEDKWDFLHAVEALAKQWKGRIGERVGERHDFYLLRFHDTPGGIPDEDWLPKYILKEVDKPDYLVEKERNPDETAQALDTAFQFD